MAFSNYHTLVQAQILQSYYDEHIQWFSKPAAFMCEVVKFTPSPQKQHLKPHEINAYLKRYQGSIDQQKVLRAFLESNKAHWKIKTDGKAIWYGFYTLPDSLSQELLLLPVGMSTKPIKIQGDWYLYRLVNKRTNFSSSFSEVKDRVYRLWLAEKRTEKWSELSDRFQELAYTKTNNLNSLARTFGLSVQKTPLLTEKNVEGLFGNDLIKALAFDPTWIQKQVNSDPFVLDDGKILVFRPLDFHLSHVPKLKEVHNHVLRSYIQDQKHKLAKKQLLQYQQKWIKDSSWMPKKARLLTRTIDRKYHNAIFSHDLIKKIFRMDFNESRFLTKYLPQKDLYLLIRLDSVIHPKPLKRTERSVYRAYKNEALDLYGHLDFHLFREALFQGKPFQLVNPSMFKQFSGQAYLSNERKS